MSGIICLSAVAVCILALNGVSAVQTVVAPDTTTKLYTFGWLFHGESDLAEGKKHNLDTDAYIKEIEDQIEMADIAEQWNRLSQQPGVPIPKEDFMTLPDNVQCIAEETLTPVLVSPVNLLVLHSLVHQKGNPIIYEWLYTYKCGKYERFHVNKKRLATDWEFLVVMRRAAFKDDDTSDWYVQLYKRRVNIFFESHVRVYINNKNKDVKWVGITPANPTLENKPDDNDDPARIPPTKDYEEIIKNVKVRDAADEILTTSNY